jgi:hypothetical protein
MEKLTLRQAYETVLFEIRAAETNAIVTGKPTMWSYYAECGDYFAELDQQAREGLYDVVDNKIVNQRTESDAQYLKRVLSEAIKLADFDAALYQRAALEHHGITYHGDRWKMARVWALSIYAERALRLAGFRLKKRSLDWLRAQKRTWPAAENSTAA